MVRYSCYYSGSDGEDTVVALISDCEVVIALGMMLRIQLSLASPYDNAVVLVIEL